MIKIITGLFQGMIALRRGAMEVIHEDYIDGKFVLAVYVDFTLSSGLCRCDGSSSKEEEKLNLLCIKLI